jgi:hypothetical protein
VKIFEGLKQRYMGEILFNIDVLHLSETEKMITKDTATNRKDTNFFWLKIICVIGAKIGLTAIFASV